ncbi:MAG: alanine:cation symporter family protein [Clostridia bacterium]|nr:alanine:cation symporter family protein [Clostridia bacterium]
MGFINSIITSISDLLYQPWCVPLILLLGGIFLTIRFKFIQIRMFPECFKVIMDKPKTENGISSFGALMISTASRVGTGNIIGVAGAICIGGPGAVFWMWVTAILGGALAFAESTLAQIFKKRNPDGSSYGGPAFYMQDKLKCRPLGIVFSILIIITYAIGFNMLASYNVQASFENFSFYNANITPFVIGGILAVLFAVCVIGGAKRLSKVTGILVPLMGVLYILVSVVVLFINYKNIPSMFSLIFKDAFNIKAIFGGFTGSCLMYGIKRGLYSNEAGMGSAPNAAATADTSHPAKQGLVQMLSVFLDTLLVCTCTAFMCLSSGIPFASYANKEAMYVQDSLSNTLGAFGPIFIAVALSLFAFTTLIGNYAYCEGCLKFIFKRSLGKKAMLIFVLGATALVFVGAIASAGIVWGFAELTQALMVIVNVPVIIILSKYPVRCLQDYCKQRKEGKNPVFRAKDIGINEELDFWQ